MNKRQLEAEGLYFEVKIVTNDEVIVCPKCKTADGWVRASHKKYDPKKVVECKHCGNVSAIDFEPFHKQLRIIYDDTLVLLDAGAVGTGKTVAITFKKTMIGMETPGSIGVYVSGNLPQLYQTTYTEMMYYTPPRILNGQPTFTGKTAGNLKYINGRNILFYPANENSLTSLNVMDCHMEEASGIKQEVFSQLLKRMRQSRQKSSFIKETEKERLQRERLSKNIQITITTNPEDNWVTQKVLKESGTIRNYSYIKTPERTKKNMDFVSHIADTFLNPFLPESYIRGAIAGCADFDEFLSELCGDFTTKEGRVIRDVDKYIIGYNENYLQNKPYFKVYGLDYGAGGQNDPQEFLEATFILQQVMGAYKLEIIFSAEEYCKDFRRRADHINKYFSIMKNSNYNNIYQVFGDGIHGNKNKNAVDLDILSLKDTYEIDGFYTENALNGQYSIHDRAVIMKELFEAGYIKISNACTGLISEIKDYTRKYNDKSNGSKDPMYSNKDHAIDAMMFILLDFYVNGINNPVEWFMGVYQEVKEHNYYDTYVLGNEDGDMWDDIYVI